MTVGELRKELSELPDNYPIVFREEHSWLAELLFGKDHSYGAGYEVNAIEMKKHFVLVELTEVV
jgi:hypothetical protein